MIKMLRKALCCSVLIFCAWLFIATDLFAQKVTTGTPSIYKVTMIKFEMSQNNGTTWFTVADSQVQVDIASVNAGERVGSWVSGAAVPLGTYNRMRHTVSATFVMRGFVYYNTTNRTYFTTPNGSSSVAGNVTDTTLMANFGEQSIVLPADTPGVSGGQIVAEETDNLTIAAGTSFTERITFDVSNTLALYQEGANYNFYPEPPVVDSVGQ